MIVVPPYLPSRFLLSWQVWDQMTVFAQCHPWTPWYQRSPQRKNCALLCRAKAGGRQSGKDATGKYARSAGARLRRYNEVLDVPLCVLIIAWNFH